LSASLAARGLSVTALESSYRYIAIDAGSLLAQFFRNGVLDRSRFHDRIGLLMRQVTSSGKPVRIFGEMVALVAQEYPVSVVLELEDLWNELGRFHDFVLFCGYPRSSFSGEHATEAVNRLCALHTHAVMAWPN